MFPDPMTVGAEQIAFRHLAQCALAVAAHNKVGDSINLAQWIAMMKV
jgi:hypothetical protein